MPESEEDAQAEGEADQNTEASDADDSTRV